MTDTARDYQQIESATLEGLDQLFDAEVLPSITKDHQVVPTAGLSVQEAAKVLGLSVKTVKDRLRKGTLAGFKKRDKYGDTWLVSISQNGLVIPTKESQVGPTECKSISLVSDLPSDLAEPADSAPLEESELVSLTKDYQVIPARDCQVAPTEAVELVGPTISGSQDLLVMVELLKQKDHELEGASYRIGYLEAQLEAERQQVKLLTDSLHKPSWWSKFKSWFLGAP